MSMGMAETDGRLRFVRSLQGGASGVSGEELRRRLDEQPIALVVGAQVATQFTVQVTALTAVNLLARLFRRLVIVTPDVPVHGQVPFLNGRLSPALAQFASRVHPDTRAEVATTRPSGAVALHVAGAAAGASGGDVFCHGAGWLARVGRRAVEPLAATDTNPVGALVAAALGAAEVFKVVFGDVLAAVTPAEDVTLSALTYEVGDLDVGPAPGDMRLPETTLVGAGSIGSAFLWGLAHLRAARGALTIVDHDRLEAHNPDRAILVLDGAAASGAWKAEWARDTVQPWLLDVAVAAHRGTIRGYVDSLPPDYTLPLVISAVDRVESRRDIQDALPGGILNASMGATNVEVTRHGLLSEGACLYCVYLPEVLERAPITVALARTGFAPKDVAEMLLPDKRRLLTVGDVRGIERRHDLPEGALAQYAGRPLQELLRDPRWYSQAAVTVDEGQALVTTAFVSALAGFFLLGEALKDAIPALASYRLASVYEQELLAIPNAFIYAAPRDTTGYCLCHNPLRQRLSRAKYGVARG